MAKLPDRSIPIILPSEIEAVKRLNFFELKRDETMALSEYLLSPISEIDLKKHSYSKGGMIKKGIQKLIDDSAFSASRRKFLKQASAAAAATAVPKSLLRGASSLAQASKLPMPTAVPWVKNMANMLKGAVDNRGIMLLKGGVKTQLVGGVKTQSEQFMPGLIKKLPNSEYKNYVKSIL